MSSSNAQPGTPPRDRFRVDQDECPDCGAEIETIEINYRRRQHLGHLCDCTLDIESHETDDCSICDLLERIRPEELALVHSHRDARSVVWQSTAAEGGETA